MCLLIGKAQKYTFSKGVALTTKGNTGGFKGDCYNCGKSEHMARDCPQPSKEEGGKSGQAGEDSHTQINLSEENIYINMEGFDLLSLVVEETIHKLETIDYDITGIERRILGGTYEQ